jgi:large subunit ribosomal protein L5
MKHRLKRYYTELVVKKFCEKFQYKNIHKIPRLEKIVLNRGLSRLTSSSHTSEHSAIEILKMCAQRGCITRSHRSVAGFGIRRQAPVGVIVTLRRIRIYAFFDRLANLALPAIQHFCGVKTKSFDGHGGYNLGIPGVYVFPEIDANQTHNLCGINISIVTSSRVDKERFILLRAMGIPFSTDFYGK